MKPPDHAIIQRWTVGKGGFLGEVTLCHVRDEHKPGNCVLLTNLFVHPLRRGRGWAGVLVKAATDYADKNGLDVVLLALPYRTKAVGVDALVKFYETHGFKRKASMHVTAVKMLRKCAD